MNSVVDVVLKKYNELSKGGSRSVPYAVVAIKLNENGQEISIKEVGALSRELHGKGLLEEDGIGGNYKPKLTTT